MQRKKNFSFGFTTLEAFVATTIIIALAAVVFQLLYGVPSSFGTGEAKVQAQERARLALANMVRELREISSEHIYIRNYPAIGGSHAPTFDATTSTYQGNSLLFKVPCYYERGGRKIIQLNAEGMVIFGARDEDGVFREDLSVEYCLVEVGTGRQELRRRVWPDSSINFKTLNISGAPLYERVLASNMEDLIFRAFVRSHSAQLELTVVGQGWEAKERQITAFAISEVYFRN